MKLAYLNNRLLTENFVLLYQIFKQILVKLEKAQQRGILDKILEFIKNKPFTDNFVKQLNIDIDCNRASYFRHQHYSILILLNYSSP